MFIYLSTGLLWRFRWSRKYFECYLAHHKRTVTISYYYYLFFSLSLCFRQNYLEQLEHAPWLTASCVVLCHAFCLGRHSPFPCVKTPTMSLPVPPAVSWVPVKSFFIFLWDFVDHSWSINFRLCVEIYLSLPPEGAPFSTSGDIETRVDPIRYLLP